MTPRRGLLIAVDGVSERAIIAAARRALATLADPPRVGISRFDASGLFEQLVVAENELMPSARGLLLLYAADLAFRLRWEILPALEQGKSVAAAPYVDTAIAFGRAAGLPSGWLKSLFLFARPSDVQYVDRSLVRTGSSGFALFGCAALGGRHLGLATEELRARTRTHLDKIAKKMAGANTRLLRRRSLLRRPGSPATARAAAE